MYHFLHRHKHWFFLLAVVSAVAIFWFQMKGDPGIPGAGTARTDTAGADD